MQVVKANEKIFSENKKWRKDVDAIALVTSCMAEYLSMQTVIDKEFNQSRTNLIKSIDARFNKLSTAPPSNIVTARPETAK